MLQHPVRAGEDGCTLCISASLNPFKFKVPFTNFTILMREKNPKEINNYSFYYLLKIVFVLSERMKIKRHEVFQLISICCNINIYNYAWCTLKKNTRLASYFWTTLQINEVTCIKHIYSNQIKVEKPSNCHL